MEHLPTLFQHFGLPWLIVTTPVIFIIVCLFVFRYLCGDKEED